MITKLDLKNRQKIGTAPLFIDRLIAAYKLVTYHDYRELGNRFPLVMLLRGEIIGNVFLKIRMISDDI